MTDAFISYAPHDTTFVRWLADRLREAGLTITYREVLDSPGALIVETIEQAIRDAAHGILIFSRASLADAWVREAYASLMRRSIEDGRRFIPVLIEDVDLPEFAANRFYVDLSHVDGPEVDRQLAKLVGTLRNQAPQPIPGPDQRPGTLVRPDKPRRCILRITADQVTLVPETGQSASHPPTLSPRLKELSWRLESARKRGTHITRGPNESGGMGTLLAEYGRALGSAYLTGPAADALATELAAVQAQNAALRLGLEFPDELADLPWETLILPSHVEPLALHSRVQLFRSVPATTATPSMTIPGPLRILVVMAAPEGPGSGSTLDLEAELAKILDSVEAARKGARGRPGAYVRILNQGTLQAIRDALVQERYHVLHISCHAEPGELLLEDADGRVDPVTTQRFIDEGLPSNGGVPLVVLSGCSTALTVRKSATNGTAVPSTADQASADQVAQPAPECDPADPVGPGDESDGQLALAGLARGLTAAGVPAVLAMTATVTDPYATALAGSLYYELAIRDSPQVLPAFCDARRRLEEARRRLPAGSLGASLVEWATPALFVRGPSLPLYDPADGFKEIAPPVEPQFADGVPLRKVGEFVGRRAEIRTMLAALHTDRPGVLLHGIGGVGKSSLAAELLRRLGSNAGLLVSAVSQTSPDQLLDEIGQSLLDATDDNDIRQLAAFIREPSYEWSERLRRLRPLIAQKPVTLLLDNFEDNLTYEGARWAVRNEELAEFLTSWIRVNGRHKLLVTSRYPFTLPRNAERRLIAHHLGPLSWAETRKLMWRLPGLDALSPEDQQQAWLVVGGHPRTLEYLDALLRGGRARFDDVRERLELLLDRRGILDPAVWLGAAGRELDAALAEAVRLAVDDALLGELVGLLDEFARRVLVGVSVYRRPVDRAGLAWPVSTPAAPDPDLRERLARLYDMVGRARRENPRAGLEDLGLTPDEVEQTRRDVAAESVPPIVEPDGLDTAVGVLARLGLLVPGVDDQGDASFVVHRWTAATLARPELTAPDAVTAAHAAAATFWRWRVQTRPQSPQQDLDEMVEARYHHHTAGDLDGAATATDWVCGRLRTWGAWSWEEQLYRETLSWFPVGSREQAVGYHQLGVVAYLRGDYDQALDWYRQSLTIKEELADRAGMAVGYHQLGMIAQDRGNYDQALDWYRQSLTINEDLDNQAGMARGYHQLGVVAYLGGTTTKRWTGTANPSPSLKSSATGSAWPAATTSSAWSRTCGGTTTKRWTGTANPSPSLKSSATGSAWPAATTSSA